MTLNLVLPHWLVFLLAIWPAIRWMRRRNQARNPATADPDATYECPNCGQFFATIPRACPICGQPIRSPNAA
jgi:rubrerythrin